MGTKDTVTKKYMSDAERFADIFNYFIYSGNQIIKAENLVELDATELAALSISGNTFSNQKIRDVLKQCTVRANNRAIYVLLGVENQSDVHYTMCIRNLLYDALDYSKQANALQVCIVRKKTSMVMNSCQDLPKPIP